jgi:hypothetical protein
LVCQFLSSFQLTRIEPHADRPNPDFVVLVLARPH